MSVLTGWRALRTVSGAFTLRGHLAMTSEYFLFSSMTND